jgi:O-antigen ligase
MLIFSKDNLEKNLLNILLFFVFIRSMNLGFGYPNIESMLGFASFLPQKIIQATIFLSILIYIPLYFDRIRRLKILTVTLMSFVFIILLSLALSEYRLLTFRYIVSFLTPLFVIFVYTKNYGIVGLVKALVITFSVVIVLNFLYIFLFPGYGVMGGNHSGAYRGLFLHKNIFGIFCVFSSIILMFSIVTDNYYFKKTYITLYFLCLLGVIKCQSTTSLMLFLLAFIIFNFFYFFKYINKETIKVTMYYSFLATIIALGVLLSVFYEEITYALGKDPTLTGRTELWETLFYVALEKPIFGHGLGLFQRPEIMHAFSLDFGWVAKSAHNSYLDIILGIGFTGLFIFLKPLLAKVFIFPFVKHSSYRVLSCTIIVISLFFGFSESDAFMSNSFVWLILFISLMTFKVRSVIKIKIF